MVYSRELWRNMPLYAQFADDQGIGLLQHICQSIQPHLDLVYNRLEQRDFILDAEVAPSYWLDWLQQLVALGPQGDRWLGIAVNPEWDADAKRELILGAWEYWQRKGTNPGIRWAIEHWLLWPGAASTQQLQLFQPFGDRPSNQPPRWWDFYSSFDTNAERLILEQKFLGGGDGPAWGRDRWVWWKADDAIAHWDHYASFPAIDQPWIVESAPEPRWLAGQCMSPFNVWQIFTFTDQAEWLSVAPNIYDLNPEILPFESVATVWLWLERNLVTSPWVLPPAPGPDGDPPPAFSYHFQQDGFKFTDVFPYSPHPGDRRSVTIDERESWGGDLYFDHYESLSYPGGWHENPSIARPSIADPGFPEPFDHACVFSAVVEAIGADTVTVVTGVPGRDFFDDFTVPFGHGNYRVVVSPLPVEVLIGSGRSLYAPPTDRPQAPIIPDPTWQNPTAPYSLYCPPTERLVPRSYWIDDPGEPCYPGMAVQIPTGETTTEIIPGRPPTPPNQWARYDAAQVSIADIPPIPPNRGFDHFSSLPATAPLRIAPAPMLAGTEWIETAAIGQSLLPVDPIAEGSALEPLPAIAPLGSGSHFVVSRNLIEPIAPIDPVLPGAAVPDADVIFDAQAWGISVDDFLYYPGQPAKSIVSEIPERWRWESPVYIFNHFASWDEWLPFYSPGDDGTPDRVVSRPVMETAYLCNIRDNFTMFEVEEEWWEPIDVPETSQELMTRYPDLEAALDTKLWHLVLETDRGLIDIPLVAAVWENAVGDRSNRYQPRQGFDRLVLEFTFTPDQILRGRSLSLVNNGKLRDRLDLRDIDLRPAGIFGWRYQYPIKLGTPVVV